VDNTGKPVLNQSPEEINIHCHKYHPRLLSIKVLHKTAIQRINLSIQKPYYTYSENIPDLCMKQNFPV